VYLIEGQVIESVYWGPSEKKRKKKKRTKEKVATPRHFIHISNRLSVGTSGRHDK
jgi:hypothetical protein